MFLNNYYPLKELNKNSKILIGVGTGLSSAKRIHEIGINKAKPTDPSIHPTIKLTTKLKYNLSTNLLILGRVEYVRWLYGYSNVKHQDYVFYDITLTNNGKVFGFMRPSK